MENFGIDIGDFKTVITGTARNGRILNDYLGKRSISTQIQLSIPRKFGNDVSGMKMEDLEVRFRHFFELDKQASPEEKKKVQNLITMYFCFLKRTIHSNMDRSEDIALDKFSPIVHLTSKLTNFNDIKQMVLSGIASDMKITTVFDDLTAAAAFVTFKIKSFENFVIMDFGHSQTSIGLFCYKDGHLFARNIKRISIGGGHFDEKLLYHFLAQCDLETEKESKDVPVNGYAVSKTKYRPVNFVQSHKFHVLKEAAISKFKKIKTMLSNSDTISDVLEYVHDAYTVTITKDEYKNLISDELEEIKKFIFENLTNFKSTYFQEGETNLEIEIIGGNSNNFLIKNLLNENEIKFRQSCDPHEGISFGLTIAGALTSSYNQYNHKISDCLVGDISCNGVVIFKDGDLLGTNISLSQHKNQLIIVKDPAVGIKDEKSLNNEDEEEKDQEDEKPNSIPFNRQLKISHDGQVFCCLNPTYPCSLVLGKNKTVYVKNEAQEIEDLSGLLESERKFREKEIELEYIGKINNDMQLFLGRFEEMMSLPIYFALFSEEEISQVSDVSMELMSIFITKDLKTEEEKIKVYTEKISHFIKRMEDLIVEKKKAAFERIDKSLENLKKIKIFTPTLFQLQSRLNGDKLRIEKLTFESKDFSVINLDKLDMDIVNMELQIEKEVIQKEKEEKEREETERIAKEELAKQEAENKKKVDKKAKDKNSKQSKDNNSEKSKDNSDEKKADAKKQSDSEKSSDEKKENKTKDENMAKKQEDDPKVDESC